MVATELATGVLSKENALDVLSVFAFQSAITRIEVDSSQTSSLLVHLAGRVDPILVRPHATSGQSDREFAAFSALPGGRSELCPSLLRGPVDTIAGPVIMVVRPGGYPFSTSFSPEPINTFVSAASALRRFHQTSTVTGFGAPHQSSADFTGFLARWREGAVRSIWPLHRQRSQRLDGALRYHAIPLGHVAPSVLCIGDLAVANLLVDSQDQATRVVAFNSLGNCLQAPPEFDVALALVEAKGSFGESAGVAFAQAYGELDRHQLRYWELIHTALLLAGSERCQDGVRSQHLSDHLNKLLFGRSAAIRKSLPSTPPASPPASTRVAPVVSIVNEFGESWDDQATALAYLLGQETEFPYELVTSQDSVATTARAMIDPDDDRVSVRVVSLSSDELADQVPMLTSQVVGTDATYVACVHDPGAWSDPHMLSRLVQRLEGAPDSVCALAASAYSSLPDGEELSLSDLLLNSPTDFANGVYRTAFLDAIEPAWSSWAWMMQAALEAPVLVEFSDDCRVELGLPRKPPNAPVCQGRRSELLMLATKLGPRVAQLGSEEMPIAFESSIKSELALLDLIAATEVGDRKAVRQAFEELDRQSHQSDDLSAIAVAQVASHEELSRLGFRWARTWLDVWPSSAELHRATAQACMTLGKAGQATKHLRLAFENATVGSWLWGVTGLEFAGRKLKDGALGVSRRTVRQVLDHFPDDPEAKGLLALIEATIRQSKAQEPKTPSEPK